MNLPILASGEPAVDLKQQLPFSNTPGFVDYSTNRQSSIIAKIARLVICSPTKGGANTSSSAIGETIAEFLVNESFPYKNDDLVIVSKTPGGSLDIQDRLADHKQQLTSTAKPGSSAIVNGSISAIFDSNSDSNMVVTPARLPTTTATNFQSPETSSESSDSQKSDNQSSYFFSAIESPDVLEQDAMPSSSILADNDEAPVGDDDDVDDYRPLTPGNNVADSRPYTPRLAALFAKFKNPLYKIRPYGPKKKHHRNPKTVAAHVSCLKSLFKVAKCNSVEQVFSLVFWKR